MPPLIACFAGSAALVTGGPGDLGPAAARRLAEDGAAVLILGGEEARPARAPATLRSAVPGPVMECRAADVTDPAVIARAVDVAAVAVIDFLASGEAPYVAGSAIVVDGGRTA